MFRIIVNFFKPPTKQALGRWNIEHCHNIKSVLANYDHCGDSICKDPKEVKKFIDLHVEENKLAEEEENKKKVESKFL